MKIEGRKRPQSVANIGPVGMPAPAEVNPAAEAPAPPAADQVNLSSTQQIRTLKAALAAVPDVRMEKVQGLRGAIEEGSYYVESEKLARKVVNDALAEALLEEQEGKR